jgi:enamine deaminase RidA (YjgF/YER057c/UK114 family)
MPGSLPAGTERTGFEEQARRVFSHLRYVLDSAGASFDDVVMVRAYLAREEDFPALNAVFDETFKTPFPVRTTVWVHLPGGLLIEADLLAVVG